MSRKAKTVKAADPSSGYTAATVGVCDQLQRGLFSVRDLPSCVRRRGGEHIEKLEAFARSFAGLSSHPLLLSEEDTDLMAMNLATHVLPDVLRTDFWRSWKYEPAARQLLMETAHLTMGLLRMEHDRRHNFILSCDSYRGSCLKDLFAIADSIQPLNTNWLGAKVLTNVGSLIINNFSDRQLKTNSTSPGSSNVVLTLEVIELCNMYAGEGWYYDISTRDIFRLDYYSSIMTAPALDLYFRFWVDYFKTAVRSEIKVSSDEICRVLEVATMVRSRLRTLVTTLVEFVAPDGSFPQIGRSLAYRAGVFHALAHYIQAEPTSYLAGRARNALDRVFTRYATLNIFDPKGFLTLDNTTDVVASQAEDYISNGSLYAMALGVPIYGHLDDSTKELDLNVTPMPWRYADTSTVATTWSNT